jgi:hypothetical protein
LLKTESGELSHVISSDRLDDLPILATGGAIRSSFAQVDLLPGAGHVGGGFGGGALRVNGMPGATLSVRIEGQDATQTGWTTSYAMGQPGVDSIEETAIQTSNFAAEYGQAGGGVFNMTMRSGTNALHGSAYLYFRNEGLNAYPPFRKTGDKNRDRRQDFGFTTGGPVYIPKVYDGRDRTFFFWSFEQNRNATKGTVFRTVPTAAYRLGDFSSPDLYTKRVLGTDPLGREILEGAIYDPSTTRTVTGLDGNPYTVRDPFPNNYIDPSRFDPVAAKFQSLIPQPTEAGLTTNNFRASTPSTSVQYITSVKADHNLSSKIKISGYWSLNRAGGDSTDGFDPPVTTTRNIKQSTNTARLGLDYTISPTTLLSLGAGLMNWVFEDPVPDLNYDNLKELGLPGTYATIPPTFYYLGTAAGGLGAPTGQGNSSGPVAQQKQWLVKPTATANLTMVRSNHSYKFGAEMVINSFPSLVQTPANGWFRFNCSQTALPYFNTCSPPGTGGSIGFPYASFMLGAVDGGEIGQPNKFHLGKQAWSFFAQDSWKITPRLTLDYGLRYDYQTYLKEQYGRIPSFGYDTPNPRFGNLPGAVIFEHDGPDFAKNYPHAWGPRLGIAYQFMPKTVLRAGIGISYGQTGNLEMWSLRFGSLIRYNTSVFGEPIHQLKDGPSANGQPIVPVWPNYDPGQLPIAAGDAFMTSFDRNAGRPPRQVMWSIGIQRELTQDLSLEVSYVGNRGVWWMSNGSLTDPNRVTPEILADHNLSLSNADDRALLTTPIGLVSPQDAADHNIKLPYADFPSGSTVSQSLRPYPHIGGIFVLWAPLGNTWYDALQMKFTKRYSHGLDFTAAYSFQKELTIGAETFDPAFAPAPPSVNDISNLKSNKVLSGLSIPHRLSIGANYRLPRLDVYAPLSWAIRDWQFGAYLIYGSNRPIQAPAAQNNLASQLSLCAPMNVFGQCNGSGGAASFANRVPGEPLFTVDLNSDFDPFTTFTLNPNAWADPAPGEYGVGSAYYNDYRRRRTPTENLSLARIFRFKEGMQLQIRLELYNAFNRVDIPTPSSGNAKQTQVKNPDGTTRSGFGYISAINAGGARTGQLVARFQF